jgi:type IV fimbrial biogenesis protein FimT
MSIGRNPPHWMYCGSIGPQRTLRGVTLIELLVTLVVLAILMMIAAPSFTRMVATNRLATQTNEFVSTLNLARSEAIRRSQAVSLVSNNTANPEQFQAGWVVITDADANGVTDSDGTTLREVAALAGSTTITRVTRTVSSGNTAYASATSSLTDRGYVVFNARGGNNAGGSAFFRVCSAGDATIPGRIVQISSIGRVSLDSTNSTCS